VWSDKARRQLVYVRLQQVLLTNLKAAGLNCLPQQGFVLTGKITPGTESVEIVGEAVLVNQRRQCEDLFEPFGRRHLQAEVCPQPAVIVEPVLRDDANAGRQQIRQPSNNVLAREVLAVGMAQRNIDGADLTISAPSNADATDVSVAPGPRRTTVCAQAI